MEHSNFIVARELNYGLRHFLSWHAKIILKKGLILQPKVAHFEKFAAAHSAAKLFHIFFLPSFVAQHGHYTSNLLPTPMSAQIICTEDTDNLLSFSTFFSYYSHAWHFNT